MSTAEMDDLVTWLYAQLDTDDQLAVACQNEVGTTRVGEMYPDGSGPCGQDDYPSYPWGSGSDELAFMAAFDPDRVRREVQAKRRILSEVPCTNLGRDGYSETVKLLALPYADRRPGYRQEWRP